MAFSFNLNGMTTLASRLLIPCMPSALVGYLLCASAIARTLFRRL
jgi:hypothetical protein